MPIGDHRSFSAEGQQICRELDVLEEKTALDGFSYLDKTKTLQCFYVDVDVVVVVEVLLVVAGKVELTREMSGL